MPYLSMTPPQGPTGPPSSVGPTGPLGPPGIPSPFAGAAAAGQSVPGVVGPAGVGGAASISGGQPALAQNLAEILNIVARSQTPSPLPPQDSTEIGRAIALMQLLLKQGQQPR